MNWMSTLGIECNNSMPTFMVGSKLRNQKKTVSAEIHTLFRLKNYKNMDARTISPSVPKKTTCLF